MKLRARRLAVSFYLCWLTVAVLANLEFGSGFKFEDRTDSLAKGSSCRMEDGSSGICRKLIDCPSRLAEVLQGHRQGLNSQGRCGFEGQDEIVCCTDEQSASSGKSIENRGQHKRKPVGWWAEQACNEYDRKYWALHGLTQHIRNGTLAVEGEFPFAAALGYRIDGKIAYNCGGTLISYQHVLTAAHCIVNVDKLEPVHVRLGSSDLKSKSSHVRVIPITKPILVHPQYTMSRKYHDIAILTLAKPIVITDYIHPLCLQLEELEPKELNQLIRENFAKIYVIGWGLSSFVGDQSDRLYKTAPLELVDRSTCEKSYRGLERTLPKGITREQFCLIDPDRSRRSDSCQGDSGGPLIYGTPDPQRLLGVTSFGRICGAAAPGVYTNIQRYLDWIERVVWNAK